MVGPASSYQVTESLNDNAAAQHVGEPCYALAVTVAVLERHGEVLGHQQCKIRVACLALRIFVTVAVYRNDPVGVLVYNASARVHAERADFVLERFGPVDDFALVQLIREVREELSRQLDPDSDVDTVGLCRDLKFFAYLLHPLAAASAD